MQLMKTFVQSSTSGSWSKPPLELTALQPATHPGEQHPLPSLTTRFQRDDMYDIEVDLNQMLLRLLPEPCWQEDPFEFLSNS